MDNQLSDNLIASFVFYPDTSGKKNKPPVPSINEYYSLANAAMRSRGRSGMFAAQNFIRDWRQKAFLLANQYYLGNLIGPSMVERARVEVIIYWPNKRRRDIVNLFYKAILDGFTDAGVWTDDSVIEIFTIRLGGIDKENPRVVFNIYSL